VQASVLIVGAGPTGLVLALWLSQFGISARIIDKSSGPGETSRAMGVQARTLEHYAQIGLANEVIAKGIKANIFNIRKNGKKTFALQLGDMGKDLSPYPFMLTFPQDDHEQLLIEHLQRAGISVERNTELISVQQNTDSVTVQLTSPHGTETFNCAYLCACDGARSTIRSALNIAFSGGTYSQIFYVADVLAEAESAQSKLQMCVDHEDFCMVLPIRSSGSYRLIGIAPYEIEHQEHISFDDIRSSVLYLTQLKIQSLNWFSTYHVHHRVAAQFRKDRIFLLGDAAHIHSPAGAQGMNTGIGDAINLAWKIAAVLQKRAAPAVLDSYEIERQRFAKQLVATTDRMFTIMTNRRLLGACWRGFIFPYLLPLLFRWQGVRHYFFKMISQIRITYRHSPLSKGGSKKIAAGDRLPWIYYADKDNFASLQLLDWQIHIYGTAHTDFEHALQQQHIKLNVFPWDKQAQAAGLIKDAIYLIRPDAYIAYIDSRQDSEQLKQYLAQYQIISRR
jgi:2-polyprenyl-6-methoxyphenol hydroxylase-like FAD-dependent oxidoreductase